ncbi:MAG: putative lipid II flippase FtsW [Thermodesulfobacteriota bacterium]|nr:putative lipid II flippase FtsW [Thermodesulfobacteriota bacterium]
MRLAQKEKTGFLYVDISLLFPVLLLAGIGIVMVYSASSHIAAERFADDAYFLKRQAVYLALGIMVMIVCSCVTYRIFRVTAYLLLAAAFACLGALYVSGVGYSAGGATRWLHLGPVSFQPSVFAKLALIIYLAYSLHKKQDKLARFSIGFLPHMIVFGMFSILIFLQPDFGSVVIFGAITWTMLFVAGVRPMHLFSSFIFLLPLVIYYMVNAEYRLNRLISFMDPWAFRTDEGYQVVHSLMAFGTGGIWGTGIGQGYQKLFYLPEPHTDFIVSVVGEELGLLGVLAVLCLYSVILWRGIMISKNARDMFARLVALGLTAAISFQVFVNMGVAVGILPTKGLTLPFLSYGGTSLLFNMAAIGILMNIGQRGQQKNDDR